MMKERNLEEWCRGLFSSNIQPLPARTKKNHENSGLSIQEPKTGT
jgi:hypothetical protein